MREVEAASALQKPLAEAVLKRHAVSKGLSLDDVREEVAEDMDMSPQGIPRVRRRRPSTSQGNLGYSLDSVS